MVGLNLQYSIIAWLQKQVELTVAPWQICLQVLKVLLLPRCNKLTLLKYPCLFFPWHLINKYKGGIITVILAEKHTKERFVFSLKEKMEIKSPKCSWCYKRWGFKFHPTSNYRVHDPRNYWDTITHLIWKQDNHKQHLY